MLDQDAARALLTIADEAQVRVALVGDRHQLAAVGRGGVLELATRWTRKMLGSAWSGCTVSAASSSPRTAP